jgi:hypothetical protein
MHGVRTEGNPLQYAYLAGSGGRVGAGQGQGRAGPPVGCEPRMGRPRSYPLCTHSSFTSSLTMQVRSQQAAAAAPGARISRFSAEPPLAPQATRGALRASVRPFGAASRPGRALVVAVSAGERLRLHNLSPEPGSRRDEKRKGRGTAAGQVRFAPQGPRLAMLRPRGRPTSLS